MHARAPHSVGGPLQVAPGSLPTPPANHQQLPHSQYPQQYSAYQQHRGGFDPAQQQQQQSSSSLSRDYPPGGGQQQPPPPFANNASAAARDALGQPMSIGNSRMMAMDSGGGGSRQQQMGLPPPSPQQQQQGRTVNGQHVIGPSHPSHPQHAAWVAHQQQLQLAAVGGQGPGPGGGGNQGGQGGQYFHHPQQQQYHAHAYAQLAPSYASPTVTAHPGLPPSSSAAAGHHPGAPPRIGPPSNNGAVPYGNTFVQIPPPPSPITAASPRLPPGMHPSIPLAPPSQHQQQHGQIAPPARTIPSAAGMRPLSSLAGTPPHANNTSPFPQYVPANSSQPQPPPIAAGHPSLGHRQSISGVPLPPQQHYQQQQMHHQQQQQQPQYRQEHQREQTGPPPPPPAARQVVRPSLAPQPNTLLAAHVAVNGTGPITATSAPSGPALSRLAALNEALQLALESDSPLESLRIAVADHFTDTGVVKIGLFDPATPMSKVFEIPCSAFPRFQHINHLLGAISSTFSPVLVREFRLTTPDPSSPRPSSPGGGDGPPHAPFPVHIGYLLRSEDAMWSSRFNDGARVDLRGSLTMHLMFKDLGNGAAGLRIESLEFDARGFEEYVPRSVLANLERALSAATADAASAQAALKAAAATTAASANADDTPTKEEEENLNGSRRRSSKTQQGRGMNTRRRSAATKAELDNDDSRTLADESQLPSRDAAKGSSTTTASNAASGETKGYQHGDDSIEAMRDRIAPSPVGAFGVTVMGMRCLEIAESVAQLQNLIAFSLESGFGPIDALSRYADMHRSGVFAPLNGPPAGGPMSGSSGGGGGGDHGMYNGPGPVQQTFAAHPGLGGDIGGNNVEMVGMKRAAPPQPQPSAPPNSAAIEMMDRDLPSPQKVPRVAATRGRGRGR
ncbi:hypothetical protein JCM10908_006928 [Rhodotorula pacifica]|uniref:uncharacterized protein n=1 Tax=Rhodotorula pacifica TaxID=1495444 RepID=UPI00317ECFBD